MKENQYQKQLKNYKNNNKKNKYSEKKIPNENKG